MKTNTGLLAFTSIFTTLLWVGLLGTGLFFGFQFTQNYITIQTQTARREAILGCAQASKSTYTEKADNWERSTEEPNQKFYTTCLDTVLGE